MKKVKRLFLFGAGAALEWGAPTTSTLTDMILKSGFKTSDNITRITKFIYQTLIENGYDSKDVNFETIISVIEELLIYYSNFDSRRRITSLLKCFFDSKFKEEILNFSIEDGVLRHGYTLQIPKGVKYEFSKHALQNETPEQFFLQHLIGVLLTDISSIIREYSYYSKQYSALDINSEFSKSFVEWMKLHKEQTSLRIYTLNYDRIFQTLLGENGISIFEGFDTEMPETSTYGVRPNVNQILRDFNADICYNLHGCVNWDVEELDFHQLANPEILYRKYPSLPVNNTPASVQIEKGKTIMVTNIVIGYQKAQKSMITPFKQMQSAFDIDCSMSEEIYVVGYSFGDEHINESLRTAIRHNLNLKMIIVDPNFMKNDFDLEVSMKLFSAANSNFVFAKTLEKNVHTHMDGTFLVYTMAFEEFRKRQLNPFNKAARGIHYP